LDRFARNLRLTLEYFDKLAKAGVTLISINEQMDFSTPSGKVHLALLGAFAQYYSDNLSQETKKGWTERREQGLYCGTLPFGAVKGEDGVPVPDVGDRKVFMNGDEIIVRNYDGLKMAFDLSAEGKSDKEIAIAINTEGYRTTGTHGPRPFSKDTVKNILKNKFYIGYIRDGNDGWRKAKHTSFIQPSIFEEVQRMRENRNTSRNINRARAKIYSLSGIARCADCGSTLRSFQGKRRVRLVCNGRLKSGECTQPSTLLEVYEQQLRAYLSVFTIPEDYQAKILEAHSKLQSTYDVDKQRASLQTKLNRVKELYKWGHGTKEEYFANYVALQRELRHLKSNEPKPEMLEKFAEFLKNVALAWDKASQEQRNRLASCLLEKVWIKDKKVVAVTPRPEFKPFFDLQYDGLSHYVLHWRPRWDLNPRSPP
jgi:hypothetical protein